MKLCKKIKTENCLDRWIMIALFLTTVAGYDLLAAQTKPQTGSAVKTNAPPPQPIVVEIPKSVFIWNPKEVGYGRDPFFPIEPDSVKTNEQKSITTTKTIQQLQPQKPVVDLKLQGIIGNIRCIINGKQISIGDEEIIPYSSGRIKVKCNKIEDGIAYITIIYNDGTTENRELSMKAKK